MHAIVHHGTECGALAECSDIEPPGLGIAQLAAWGLAGTAGGGQQRTGAELVSSQQKKTATWAGGKFQPPGPAGVYSACGVLLKSKDHNFFYLIAAVAE